MTAPPALLCPASIWFTQDIASDFGALPWAWQWWCCDGQARWPVWHPALLLLHLLWPAERTAGACEHWYILSCAAGAGGRRADAAADDAMVLLLPDTVGA